MDLIILKNKLKDFGVPINLIPNTEDDFSYANMFKKFIEFIKSDELSKFSIPYKEFNETYKGEHLGKGTFNQAFKIKKTQICDTCILRLTIHRDVDEKNLFNSFYENIKHLILYICIYSFDNKPKIIPKPYKLGFTSDENNNPLIYMIMEQGTITLDKYIINETIKVSEDNDDEFINTEVNKKIIKKIILNIYQILYLLNDTHIISEFKHNDLKCNNIVLSITKKPLLIDFGSAQFIIKTKNGIDIEFISTLHTNPPLYNNSIKIYNVISDMLLFIWSLKVHAKIGDDIYELLNFISDDCNKWILSEINIKELFAQLFKYTFGNIAMQYMMQYMILSGGGYDLSTLKFTSINRYIILPELKKEKLVSPDEFKTCMKLDSLNPIDSFKYKYLKYKQKYILLKNIYKSIK
jgi:hypothetical protein